jgi:hypothetical protein
MRRKTLAVSIQSLALFLILSVTAVTSLQISAEAMLAPASAVSGGEVNRAADIATIQKTLESKIIRQKLHAMGLSDPEIDTRLSRLSDQQVHQLASQIRAVHPAGDAVVYILVVVILVLLVIYLFKRI